MRNLIFITVFLFLFNSLSFAKLKEGDKIPDLKFKIDTGETISFKELRGKWVILYFYPKDNPACIKDLKFFSKLIRKFHKYNSEVFGVNTESIESHRKFKKRYRIYLKLISDREGKLSNIFGFKTIEGFCTKNTVLIDKKGKIKKIFVGLNPDSDPKELLEYVKNH
jgi:peroxiredoxin Q/BCP